MIAVAVIAAGFAAREQELDVSLNIRAVFIGIDQLAFAAAGCNGPGHHCTSQTCTDDQGRAAGTARGDVAWSGRNRHSAATCICIYLVAKRQNADSLSTTMIATTVHAGRPDPFRSRQQQRGCTRQWHGRLAQQQVDRLVLPALAFQAQRSRLLQAMLEHEARQQQAARIAAG